MGSKKEEENLRKRTQKEIETKLKEKGEEIRNTAVKNAAANKTNGSNEDSDSDLNTPSKIKRRVSRSIFNTNTHVAEELEIICAKAEHRRKIEKHRIWLYEKRLEDAASARKDELEMRWLSLKAQKALADALAAIAEKLIL